VSLRLAVLGVIALGGVACSGLSSRSSEPAEPNAELGKLKPTQVGRYKVGLELVPEPPPLGELFRVQAQVTLKDGTPLETGVVTLDARMPAHDHGMETRPRVREGECTPTATDDADSDDSDDTDVPARRCRHPGGTYIADGFKFHMSGDWTVLVSIDGPAGPDTTTFVYRMP